MYRGAFLNASRIHALSVMTVCLVLYRTIVLLFCMYPVPCAARSRPFDFSCLYINVTFPLCLVNKPDIHEPVLT